MKKQTLGRGLAVSAVSLGCMGMTHAYGAPSDKKEMIELMAQAVDMGYTMFDTAPAYTGKKGLKTEHNEDLVGEALKPYREKVVIATKFGLQPGMSMDARPETIRKNIDTSLKRLKTDHVDLYYLHRVNEKTSVEEVAGVMQELMKAGKILHWGISNIGEETIRKAHRICPLTAIQNRYHMMSREAESLFPVLEELGIGLVSYSPLANGFLTGAYDKHSHFRDLQDWRSFMPQFKQADENKQLLDMLREFANEKGVTPAALSLAWMIDKKPYIVPIPGTRKLSRLEENASAAEVNLSQEEIRKLDVLLEHMPMSQVFGRNTR